MVDPETLVMQSARAAAPHLTAADLSLLPRDLWEVLQRYMDRERQIELFSESRKYIKNGQLQYQCRYKDGVRHGECKSYHYGNGRLAWHRHYKDDRLHGESKEYYSDGQLLQHCHYKNGNKHGDLERYYEGGQLMWHIHYKDGNRHGEYNVYNEDGQLIDRGTTEGAGLIEATQGGRTDDPAGSC